MTWRATGHLRARGCQTCPPQAALPHRGFDLHSVESSVHPLPCSSKLPPLEEPLSASHQRHGARQGTQRSPPLPKASPHHKTKFSKKHTTFPSPTWGSPSPAQTFPPGWMRVPILGSTAKVVSVSFPHLCIHVEAPSPAPSASSSPRVCCHRLTCWPQLPSSSSRPTARRKEKGKHLHTKISQRDSAAKPELGKAWAGELSTSPTEPPSPHARQPKKEPGSS